MYPLLCAGGFPCPEKVGIITIESILAVPVISGAEMDMQLRDDDGSTAHLSETQKEIACAKNDGSNSVYIQFNTPLKTRRGIKATTMTNARVYVYTR
jgi:hypothetical protein